MTINLEPKGRYLVATREDGYIYEYPSKDIRFREYGDEIVFYEASDNSIIYRSAYTDLLQADGSPFPSREDLLGFLRAFTGGMNSQGDSAMDVFLQDQTTPAIIAKMSTVSNETTTTANASIGDVTIDVTDPTGAGLGSYVSIFSVTDNRFYIGESLGVVGNTVTLDSPLDFAFASGSFVTFGSTDLAVDGSTTSVIYGLRNTDEAVDTDVDITRLIITCLTTNAPAYDDFGDIANGLENGLVVRKKDGTYRNIFNIKTNGDMAGIAYDFSAADSVNPNQGQNGWISRLTFGGQNKIGVVIRIESGEDLQAIVQDDLSSLELLEIVVEGHEVKR